MMRGCDESNPGEAAEGCLRMAGICQRAVLTLVLALPFSLSFLPSRPRYYLFFLLPYYHLDSASQRSRVWLTFDDSLLPRSYYYGLAGVWLTLS